MYKKRLLISPYIGRSCRSVLLGALLCLGLWAALLVRSSTDMPLSLAPPLTERDLGYLRASRRLAAHLDDGAEPLITPQSACEGDDSVPVVALVSSAPGNAEERAAIRATWGSELPTYFFMGRSGRALDVDEQMVDNYMEARQHGDIVVGAYSDAYENLTLKTCHMLRWALRRCPRAQFVMKVDNYMEARQHGDIVVGAYSDAYENLTLKTCHMLGWALRRCPRAQFVMKTDDDVLVNPWALRRVVAEHQGKHLVGYMKNSSVPHRDQENKWYLPRWLYREDIIPEYLSGTGYLISGEHLQSIYRAAFSVPLINLEDVYLTYLVAKRELGLNLTHDPRLSPYHPPVPSACAYWSLASAHSLTPNQIWTVWPKIRALAEQYQEGRQPCGGIGGMFGFLSWGSFLV